MLNGIKVDLRKLLLGKEYWRLAIAAGMIYPFLILFFMFLLGMVLNSAMTCDMTQFGTYATYSPFVIAGFVSYFFYGEYQDGVLRNKLISGKKRYEIFFAACGVSAIFSVITQMISFVTIAGAGFLFRTEWEEVTLQGIGGYLLVLILASVSLAVFDTAIFLCLGNTKVVVAIPLGICMLMKVVLMYILDKLYPTEGPCLLTGTRLMVYRGIDRMVPFAYTSGLPRWGMGSYLLGAGSFIVLSSLIGLFLFQKKDIY